MFHNLIFLIKYISKYFSKKKTEAFGLCFHGGWIFWDETEQHPSMAYVSRRSAEEALKLYIKELNDDANYQVNVVNREAVGTDHYIEDPNGPTGR